MTPEEYRKKAVEKMKLDFIPPHDPNAMPSVENRVANALEYIAFQLGQTNRNVSRIADLLHVMNAK